MKLVVDSKYLCDYSHLSDEDFGRQVRSCAADPHITSPDSLNARKADFIILVSQTGEEYPSDMLLDFCKYWTEHGDRITASTKMRFEKEKTWNTSARLERWARNNKNARKPITTKSEDREAVNRDVADILGK